MSRKAGTITEETRNRLLSAAVEEFAEFGFQKASLRHICAKAEVTTGALYFLFTDKEDLFTNVITPVTKRIMLLMQEHYEAELASTSDAVIKEETEDFRAADEFFAVYFSNKAVCEIILNNREHPAVISFFDGLTELMDNQTKMLLNQTNTGDDIDNVFNDCTVHWFSHLQIDAVMHIISHDFSETQAKEQLKIMVRFMRGGFFSLLMDQGSYKIEKI